MTIIFAGAPVLNAIIAMIIKPPAGGYASVNPLFWVGLVLAIGGGYLVGKFKPGPPQKKPAASAPAVPAPATSEKVPQKV
jgi:hypothetical protein